MTEAHLADEPHLPVFLRIVLEDADAMLARVKSEPHTLAGLIETDAPQTGFLPLFDPQTIAVAVLDVHGRVRVASRLFTEERGERYVDPGLVQRALRLGKPIAVPIAIDTDHGPQSVIFVYASAAVKRVLALAYLLVWTWTEHQRMSELRGLALVNTVPIWATHTRA